MPRKPKDFTAREEAWARYRIGRGGRGNGYRAVAHDLNERRGAFKVADRRAQERRRVSAAWLHERLKRSETPTVQKLRAAFQDGAPFDAEVDIDGRETDGQPNMFSSRGGSS